MVSFFDAVYVDFGPPFWEPKSAKTGSGEGPVRGPVLVPVFYSYDFLTPILGAENTKKQTRRGSRSGSGFRYNFYNFFCWKIVFGREAKSALVLHWQ